MLPDTRRASETARASTLGLRASLVVVTSVAFLVAAAHAFAPILGDTGGVGAFMDETQSVVVALNFLTRLLYSIEPATPFRGAFYPEMSIGLLSSWPSAIGWGLGGDVLAARLASIAYCLILWIAVGYAAMRTGSSATRSMALVLSLFACAGGLLLCPGAPEIIVHAQGEISGGAWLALGYLLMPSRPRLAALVFGLCVWHTKFIYLPFALAGMAWATCTHASTAAARARLAITQLLLFLLPLAAWLLIIVLRIGTDGLAEWSVRRFGWYGRGNSGLSGPPVVRGLRARLASPRLDWSGFSSATKIRIIALLFVPSLVLGGAVVRRRSRGVVLSALDLLQLALAGVLLAFAWWYFYWNQLMWVRHVEPALLVGFAVLAYDAALIVTAARPARRDLVLAVLTMLVVGVAAAHLLVDAAALRAAASANSAARACRSATPWARGPWPDCMRFTAHVERRPSDARSSPTTETPLPRPPS